MVSLALDLAMLPCYSLAVGEGDSDASWVRSAGQLPVIHAQSMAP